MLLGKPADIIATGSSAPIAISAAYTNNKLYKKILLVSPQAISKAMIDSWKTVPTSGATSFYSCDRNYYLQYMCKKGPP